MSVAIDIA